ncbi:MAG: pilus assembly PilX family protein [Pseudomonadota bacterium]
MPTPIPAELARQRGVSTLVVAIVLLIAATFLTFFAAKIGMQEQRMSGNDYRHKEAFNLAEAGLDRAKAFLAANRMDFTTWGWAACAGTETTPPCGDGTSNLFGAAWSWINVFSESGGAALAGLSWPASTADGPFILTQATPGAISATTSFQPVVLASLAQSLDGTGRAVVRQSLTRYLIAQPGPVPPLMAPSVGLGGNFTVVGNPNHNLDPTLDVTLANCDSLTGSGQLLSIWSRTSVTLAGSQQTCQAGSYRDPSSNARCIGEGIPDPSTGVVPAWNQCQCEPNTNEKSPYSSAAVGTNDDIVHSDAQFPGDMFLYVFGRPKAAVKASAAGEGRVLPNCDTLNASSSGLYWITGACDVAQNSTIGSRTAPVILVYETSAVFRGGSNVWGMVVGADMERTLVSTPTGPAPYHYDTDFTSASPAAALLHGTFTLHGALIVEGTVTQQGGGGNYNLLYDPCVFAAMGAGTGFDQYGPVAGSWNDAL